MMSVTISAYKRLSVRLDLELFVGGLMSYLHYLCCVFVLFVFVLCTLLFPVSLDCHFLIATSILVLPKEYIS